MTCGEIRKETFYHCVRCYRCRGNLGDIVKKQYVRMSSIEKLWWCLGLVSTKILLHLTLFHTEISQAILRKNKKYVFSAHHLAIFVRFAPVFSTSDFSVIYCLYIDFSLIFCVCPTYWTRHVIVKVWPNELSLCVWGPICDIFCLVSKCWIERLDNNII